MTVSTIFDLPVSVREILSQDEVAEITDFESLESFFHFNWLSPIHFRNHEFFAPLQPSICVGLSWGCGNDLMHTGFDIQALTWAQCA